MDMYIFYCGMVSLSLFLMGMWLGYWLRERDKVDGVVSAMKAAIDNNAVPKGVQQQMLFNTPTIQLLMLVHWKLKHHSKVGKGSEEDFARCRSIASRIMRIKPMK
uniref:Uncharacterized protein n=1 Tax=Aeromonas phage PS TaxID=2723762 RepID=A0A6H0X6J8_9CAUD|nr:hypothetical protein [Aeromonas phage PS]